MRTVADTLRWRARRHPELPGTELEAGELIEWCRDRLAGFKRPHSVDFVEAIPRNPSGKVLKRELRRPYWTGAARQVN